MKIALFCDSDNTYSTATVFDINNDIENGCGAPRWVKIVILHSVLRYMCSTQRVSGLQYDQLDSLLTAGGSRVSASNLKWVMMSESRGPDIQAALSPGSPAAWNKHGMPQLDQLYGTSSLAVGTERAARRGNVQVLGGGSLWDTKYTASLLLSCDTFASPDLGRQTAAAQIAGCKNNRP